MKISGNDMTKIGIAGFGVVGSAVYSSLTTTGRENCYVYDKYKAVGDDLDTLLLSDYIFVCLPSPTIDSEEDSKELFEFYDYLTQKSYDGFVIQKTTSTINNDLKFPDLKLIYNPEFLNQNSAINDFKRQKCIILGGDADLCCEVMRIYNRFFRLYSDSNIQFEICSFKEAINLKYMHNLYHAYKILFWNYCHEITSNQPKMFDLYSKITGRSKKAELAQICADGKMGFGGACFPKDLVAFDNVNGHVLTEFMIEYNSSLRKTEMDNVL